MPQALPVAPQHTKLQEHGSGRGITVVSQTAANGVRTPKETKEVSAGMDVLYKHAPKLIHQVRQWGKAKSPTNWFDGGTRREFPAAEGRLQLSYKPQEG